MAGGGSGGFCELTDLWVVVLYCIRSVNKYQLYFLCIYAYEHVRSSRCSFMQLMFCLIPISFEQFDAQCVVSLVAVTEEGRD